MHGLDKIRELNDIAESKELEGKKVNDSEVINEWNSEDYHPDLPDTEILIVNLDN